MGTSKSSSKENRPSVTSEEACNNHEAEEIAAATAAVASKRSSHPRRPVGDASASANSNDRCTTCSAIPPFSPPGRKPYHRCMYGASCIHILNGDNKCQYGHTEEEIPIAAASTSMYISGSDIRCRYGASCIHIQNGRNSCVFYHPKEELAMVKNWDGNSYFQSRSCMHGAGCRYIRKVKECRFVHTPEEVAAAAAAEASSSNDLGRFQGPVASGNTSQPTHLRSRYFPREWAQASLKAKRIACLSPVKKIATIIHQQQ